MAFNSTSERLTRTGLLCRCDQGDSSVPAPLLAPLTLRLTLDTGPYRLGHHEAFLWCEGFHVTLVTQSLSAVITP
ncbi:hypothetical protein CesoFtcFv8_007447 [Champsocephalus esox]|uniref:Uncharacterized protein n=1 Tax=Champsocephalus esox TaxID=159716 RepID=A0AAN8CEL6_9TELE|nr:hypothetical protein CesoFtcFv8_007447 [Champsocephalus esox]